jgi:hypothetical protein
VCGIVFWLDSERIRVDDHWKMSAVSLLRMVKICDTNNTGVERFSSNVSDFYGVIAVFGKGLLERRL